MPIIFLINIRTGLLSIEDADKEQCKLFKELNNIYQGEKPIERMYFLKNVGFLLHERGKVLNIFKSNISLLKKFNT